ncbi:MAG: hypothetical protein M1818_004766 [Claussenomyces sp. TS43310]|nr:MAG: hypothetical protein M1818_004766 [Claussenomyces sp. TS43310]
MSQFLEPYHDRQASDGRQLPSSRGRSAFRIQRPSNRIRGGSSYVQPARSPSTAVMEHRAPEIILRTREAWEKWGELSVKISNLSSIFTTLDLWKCFEKEGHISLIEIFENNRGVRDGFARVRFTQPPPVRPFWNSIVTIALPRGEGHSRIKVELEPPKRSFQIQSPIRKHVWYPEIMRLVPTMLVFGLMHDRDSMMDMRTIEAPPRVPRSAPNQMKLTLDLLHHRVTVKFSLDLVDSRTVGTATCPLHSSDRTNKYMFQIPFTQLRKINRVNIGKDHWALIFSLDSPPAFYRKRQQEVETHEDKSFLWKEFDTWFRQTNIVYDPGALQRTAVSLDKRAPVIDIGKYRSTLFPKSIF